MAFNSILGADAEPEICEEERENMADTIDRMLHEWAADFDREETAREELKACLNGDEADDFSLDDYNSNLEHHDRFMHRNQSKSRFTMATDADSSDDTIFNLSLQLQEKDQKIQDCKLTSRARNI